MASWKCSAKRGLDIDMEMEWDGQAAADAIFEWAGFGGDSPNPSRARQGFLAYDSAEPEKKGSYKLPFCTYAEGLKAVAAGCRAAASRLPQTDIPQDVKDEARAVLDDYMGRMDEMDDGGGMDSGEESRDVAGVFAFPMPVLQRAYSSKQHEELMRRAKMMAQDPTVFNDGEPYFWPAAISTSKLDSYSTHMHNSTLRNFAAESDNGVSFLNSHRSGGWTGQAELGFGRSVRGKFVGASGNGVARTETDFYTIPDLNLNGVSTNDLIRGIRAGLVHDVSVGFHLGDDGMYRCDLCGKDYLGGECPHWLGTNWNTGEEGQRGEKVCTCAIENGHLSEVSAVYDGACPGAAIIKARRAMEAGTLTPEMARTLEPMYRINLHGARHSWVGVGSGASFGPNTAPAAINLNISTPDADSLRSSQAQIAADLARHLSAQTDRKEGSMPEQDTRATDTGQEPPNPPAADPPTPAPEQERTPPAADPPAYTAPRPEPAPEERALEVSPADWTPEQYEGVVRSVCAGAEVPSPHAAECVRRLVAHVAELSPLAESGRAYREALTREVLHECARALGKAYDEPRYRALYANATTEDLVRFHNDWKAAAAAVLPTGRTTSDTAETELPPTEVRQVPAAAYRG